MSYAPGTGSNKIATASDAALNNLVTADVLTYNATTQKWINAPVPSAVPATTSAAGTVKLAGDLAGTSSSPSVAKVNGVSVTGTPANGQVLTASSSTAASWTTPSGGGTLGNSGVTAGTYGSSTQIPIVTVNSQGLVTGASQVAAAGGSGGSGSSTWSSDYRAQNMRDLGALGDNSYNDAQFLAAVTAAKGGGRNIDTPYCYDPNGTVVIEIPAGDYRLSQIKGLLGREGMTSKLTGLTFRGAGSILTRIVLDTSTNGNAVGAMAFNDFWQNITFEGIAFDTIQSGQTFMQSYTTHAAQYYKFVDCYWNGPWKYVFDLQGDNNNSEFSFYNCGTYGMQRNVNGAFLYIGQTNTSDQFLNYWFYNFKHQSTDAALINASRGGSFHIFALDASDWGSTSGAIGDYGVSPALFKLFGDNHALGVCNFNAVGVRVEAKNADAKLLYSEWPMGNVVFRSVDYGSQAYYINYNNIIEINMSNGGGAVYSFQDSTLSGKVYIHYGSGSYTSLKKIVFERCYWFTQVRPSDVVKYDLSAGAFTPPVDFIACVGQQQNPYQSNGAVVWDATIGYKGSTLNQTNLRTILVRGANGLQNSADGNLRFLLPTGATVTEVEVMIPAGDTSDTSTGRSWTISDGSGTTIVTANFTPALNVGGRQTTTLPIPYLASTDSKATLQITANSVTPSCPNGMLLIKGYW